MTFFSIIWKNILRRKSRSGFTAAGVAIGVGAGVSLCAIAWGFNESFENAYLARGTDAIIAKLTSASLMPGFFDESRARDVASLPGVRSVAAMLSDFINLEGSDGLIVYGWQPGSFLWDHLDMREGTRPSIHEAGERVYLGVIAAGLLKKNAGDSLRIRDRVFEVAGIFESDSLVENGAVVLPLSQLQEIVGRRGKVSFLNLRLDVATTSEQFDDLRTVIERKFRGLKFYRAGEVASNLASVQASKAMSIATTAIALIVGTLGVMNAVLMSVYERTREIGLLAAVGWRRRRIVAMVAGRVGRDQFRGGAGRCRDGGRGRADHAIDGVHAGKDPGGIWSGTFPVRLCPGGGAGDRRRPLPRVEGGVHSATLCASRRMNAYHMSPISCFVKKGKRVRKG